MRATFAQRLQAELQKEWSHPTPEDFVREGKTRRDWARNWGIHWSQHTVKTTKMLEAVERLLGNNEYADFLAERRRISERALESIKGA